MIHIEGLHHVSITVTDLDRACAFYETVLGLPRLVRPPFDFPGAWFAVGPQSLHLIEGPGTRRGDRGVDSRDIHFAIRVRDFDAALAALQRLGFSVDADEVRWRIKVNRGGRAGFPQLFLLDPDHHVIELNAAE